MIKPSNNQLLRPTKCKLGKQFTAIPECASCRCNVDCRYYEEIYDRNIYHTLINYTKEHDRYQIGVIMTKLAGAKAEIGYAAIVNGNIIARGTKETILADMKQSPNKYEGEVILLPLKGAMKAMYTIELKPADPTDKNLGLAAEKKATPRKGV